MTYIIVLLTQIPPVIPVLVLLCCVYLVVAPFLEPVKVEFVYAVSYIAVGTVLYFPFAFFKLSLPGMGMYKLLSINMMQLFKIIFFMKREGIKSKLVLYNW